MRAVQETTKWSTEQQPNHMYLLDSNKMVAYIKKGESVPFYFKAPLTIDVRGRTFADLKKNPFKNVAVKSTVIKVAGSKGQVYEVDTEAKTCTCPGYLFRGTCKHLTKNT